MTVTEDARLRLRGSRRAATPKRPSWSPPVMAAFATERRVLAFDASLANTGWVAFIISGEAVSVEGHGTIRPRCSSDGYLGTWERARALRAGLWDAGLVVRYMRCPDVLKAVEAPVVGSGHRKESSLIAGMTVWMESDACAVVSATHVSAVLLGDPKIRSEARKPAVKAAVCRLVPEAAGRNWNEHERDALSVGLVRLFDLEEEAA